MIDEKKIEEAASECGDTFFEDQANVARLAFKDGINWFLDNLWHDASEEPKDCENILIECRNDINKSTYYMTMNPYYCGNFDDEAIIKRETIIRWLYIEDLMKGGK